MAVTGCWVLLIAMVAASPHRLCYDEPDHLKLTELVKRVGWSKALTSPDNPSAAGPLYPAVHLALASITRLQAPAVRWINILLLAATVFLLGAQILAARLKAILAASAIISVPFVWPSAGMALTELPALFAFTCFVFCFCSLLRSKVMSNAKKCLLAILSGVFLGIAILGRQPYATVLPVLILMASVVREKTLWILSCAACAAIPCIWLFTIWHGFAPPQYYAKTETGLSLTNGLLALEYAAAATLILSPSWLRSGDLKTTATCGLVGLAAMLATRSYQNPPAKSLLIAAFGATGATIGAAASLALAIAGIIWAQKAFVQMWARRRDHESLFTFVLLFALLAAPVCMTVQFSSRYIVSALGVLLIVVAGDVRITAWWYLRLFIGSAIGAAILSTYYR
jgi:hypothetical protein